MSKTINPIKKAKVKQARLEGKSKKQAVIDAGYSENSAINAYRLSVVKCCDEEIARSMEAQGIDEKAIIAGLKKEALTGKNSSDRTIAWSWLGKYKAMFTDKVKSEGTLSITEQEKQELDSIRPRLSISSN